MTVDFDVIIVGSGPAGVSAAYPLVESGLRVLMVDAGRQDQLTAPALPFLDVRAEDAEQWKWMIGENFHALRMREAVSPKLRAPTHALVFEDFEVANRIDVRNFIATGSLAPGGLSNAWGCGVARLSAHELSEFPFQSTEIDPSYGIVAKRIGISGRHSDDLSEYFGLDEWSQPAIQMDALHTHLYEQYEKRQGKSRAADFRLGRSRVAVLSEDFTGRKACNNSGNCLWGCHRGSLYSAAYELPVLQRHQNFFYESEVIVEAIKQTGHQWSILGKSRSNHEHRAFTARKVILAAGTLATTRLALQALNLTTPVRLLASPTAAFLLWLPRMLGSSRTNGFALGQLSFALRLRDDISGFGSTFGTTGIPISEFASHLPLRRRFSIDLLQGLMSSCLVGNLFFPGHLSANSATLRPDGSLHVDGGYSPLVPNLMVDAAKRLRSAFWQLGAILLPLSFTIGRPGGDIHYVGTLPMRQEPALAETDALGELYGLPGVHVVDGACLPTLSEKSHTLTIMANADRIGRRLAAHWQGGNEFTADSEGKRKTFNIKKCKEIS